MVACTTLGLPYQEGTDAPCDLVPIWCDFAATVEGFLVGIQNIVNRTAVGVPFAKAIKTTTEEFTQTGNPLFPLAVPFDGVIVDNDNMIDLPANAYSIYINRPGIYMIDGSITVLSTVNEIPTDEIVVVGEFGPSDPDTPSGYVGAGSGVLWRADDLIPTAGPNTVIPHNSYLIQVPASLLTGPTRPAFIATIGQIDSFDETINVSGADLGVMWVADEAP